MSRQHRWFLPEVPDLLGALGRQGQATNAGMEAFAAWAAGEPAREADVRDAEHQADRARREVLAHVRQAFVAPVGPEDIFELSERLDAVMNDAKNLVREAELLAMAPDPPIAEMARLAGLGVRDLVDAFPHLADDPDRATAAADRAIEQQRAMERVYRTAMQALLEMEDIREVQGRRELYRRCSRLGDALEHTAHRIWYAVVKED